MSRSNSRRKVGWILTGVVALLALVFGLASLQYSQSLAADVDALQAAVPCTTHPGDSSCYQLRDVLITSIDVTYTKNGAEIDIVKFLDAGTAHEVSIRPGKLDSSVLRAEESAVAILWRGRYTQLQVAGTTFVTTDNPVGQRNQFRIFAFIGILISLVMAAAIPVDVRIYRIRSGARAAAEVSPGGPPSG